jgi:prepilin-type N-terminal cleavage/methylation domain-containing protein
MSTPRGFTLIEALTAAALLGLGILSATTLAMHSLQASAGSHQQITALALASNAVECWRSGPTLCPTSAALSMGGDRLSSNTVSGTTYTVHSLVSPTAYAQLQAIEVTVSWRPASNKAGGSNDNPMAPGSGQLLISTRVSSVPVFVANTSP